MVETELDVKVKAFVEGLNSITNLGETVASTVESFKSVNEAAAASAEALKKLTEAANESSEATKKHTKEQSDFAEALKQAREALSESAEHVKSLGERLAEITGIAALVSTALGLFSGEKFFEAGIEGAKELETELVRIQAVSGETREKINEVAEEAGKIGQAFGIGDTESAQVLGILADKIGTVDDALKALEPTLQLAKIANISLADAADAVSGTLAQYSLDASQANDVTDVLTTTAQKSKIGFGDLLEQFRLIGPFAAQAGLDIRETSTVIGALADSGVRGRQATTALIEVFSALNSPTSELNSRLRGLGITSKDFGTVFEQLAEKGQEGAEVFETLSNRSQVAFGKLLSQGAPALRSLSAALQNTTGAAKTAADTITNTFATSITKAKDAFGDMAKALVTPALEPLTQEFANATKAIRDFTSSAKFQELTKSFTDFVEKSIAAFNTYLGTVNFEKVADDAKKAVEGLGTTMESIAGKVQAVVAAVGVLFNGLAFAFNTIRAVLDGVVAFIEGTFIASMTLAATVMRAWGRDTTGVEAKIKALKAGITDLGADAKKSLEAAGQNVLDIAKNVDEFSAAINKGSDNTKKLADAATEAKPAVQSIADSSQSMVQELNLIPAATDGAAKGFNAVTGQVEEFGGAADQVSTDVESIGTSLDSTANASRRIQQEITQVGKRLSDLTDAGQGFGDEANALRDRLLQLDVQLLNLGDSGKKSTAGIEDLKGSFATLKVSSQADLAQAANDAKAAFDLIAAGGTGTADSLANVRRAFLAYAQTALVAVAQADEGVRGQKEAELEATAAALGLTDQLAELVGKYGQTGVAALGSADNINKATASLRANSNATVNAINDQAEATSAVVRATNDVSEVFDKVAANQTIQIGNWTGLAGATNDASLSSKYFISSTEEQTKAVELASAATERQRAIIADFSFTLNGFGSKMADAMNQLFKAASHFLVEDTGGVGLLQFANAINEGVDKLNEKVRGLRSEADDLSSGLDDLTDTQVRNLIKLRGGVEDLAGSYEGLAQDAENGVGDLGLLDSQDLGRLSAGASAAAQRIREIGEAAVQATASIQSLLNSTLDQISGLLGDQQAIEQRRHQAALDQIEQLKEQGADKETIDKAIKAENELHSLKMKDIADQQLAQQNAQKQAADQQKQIDDQKKRDQNAANKAVTDSYNDQLNIQRQIADQIKKTSTPFAIPGFGASNTAGAGGLSGTGSGGPTPLNLPTGPVTGGAVAVTFTGDITSLGSGQQLAEQISREVTKQINKLKFLQR